MNKKRIFGICLTLLMLFTAACGRNNETAPNTAQSYGEVSAGTTQGSEDTVPGITEEYEDIRNDILQRFEESEPETDSSGNESNTNLPTYENYYYDLVNVVLYLELYDELPPNYITKNEARNLGWEGGSVENYRADAAIGGDTFGNREGLLPQASGRSYTECDIDTHGYSSRGSRRLVFSNDGLYFYTSNHYESFSQVTVTADYEVIW